MEHRRQPRSLHPIEIAFWLVTSPESVYRCRASPPGGADAISDQGSGYDR